MKKFKCETGKGKTLLIDEGNDEKVCVGNVGDGEDDDDRSPRAFRDGGRGGVFRRGSPDSVWMMSSYKMTSS